MGASYFRAVGKGLTYGLSARGLAIDTALESGEEFPCFKEFWLRKPRKDAKTLTVYALLDSLSTTGAYQFVVKPGKETRIEVLAKFYKRKEIKKLGIAPLTSMFFYGENMNQRPVDDFRPEVHDSDGLLIVMDGGEKIWRPLVNPTTLQVISFNLKNPKGFGLLQRDLNFDHYQDLKPDMTCGPAPGFLLRKNGEKEGWNLFKFRQNKSGIIILCAIGFLPKRFRKKRNFFFLRHRLAFVQAA